jgi:hypothetical protein
MKAQRRVTTAKANPQNSAIVGGGCLKNICGATSLRGKVYTSTTILVNTALVHEDNLTCCEIKIIE